MCFTDFSKLNMNKFCYGGLVLYSQADFYCCPNCLKNWYSIQKRWKNNTKKSSHCLNLNPCHKIVEIPDLHHHHFGTEFKQKKSYINPSVRTCRNIKWGDARISLIVVHLKKWAWSYKKLTKKIKRILLVKLLLKYSDCVAEINFYFAAFG